jgi:hypothetical protein
VKYALLIYEDPTQDSPSPESPEGQAEFARWGAYSEKLVTDGVMVDGAPLQQPDTGTTIRVRGGDRLVTDGPFADTKEWLAGYYVIEVGDLDVAIDYAGQMPNIAHGSTEVRPVMDIPGM